MAYCTQCQKEIEPNVEDIGVPTSEQQFSQSICADSYPTYSCPICQSSEILDREGGDKIEYIPCDYPGPDDITLYNGSIPYDKG